MSEPSLWSFIAHAGPIVKLVMLLLFSGSLASWTMIFQRGIFLRGARSNIAAFEERFWSGIDAGKFYQELYKRRDELTGLEHIFYVGFDEFTKLNKKAAQPDITLKGVQHAMRIALAREVEELEKHLPFLATVGSISPYIGLFGTVWGIMTSFRSLGGVQQATIAMVAPGISEALIATAIGLFAAIPAVIAYNRFASDVERIANHYSTFQEEFYSILYRQAYTRGTD